MAYGVVLGQDFAGGGVESVNNKKPDDNGNINITASDINALSTSGGTMKGGIAMSSNRITNLAPPINSQDAVNKKYMEEYVKTNSGSGMSYVWPSLSPAGGSVTGDVVYFTDEIGMSFMSINLTVKSLPVYKLFSVDSQLHDYGVANGIPVTIIGSGIGTTMIKFKDPINAGIATFTSLGNLPRVGDQIIGFARVK